MRIGINLASEPFRRDRPMLAASTAVGVVLVLTLGLLALVAVSERGQESETREAIGRLEREIRRLEGEQRQLEAVLQRPENAEVLDKVLFINTLIYRKGISWARMFADLEEVVPHNVRLIAVRPQVSPRNEVVLEMVVGSQNQPPVIEMLKQLEQSPQFGDTAVHNWLPPAQTEPLYRYRISVNYAQKF
jgi:type IV pilus assembly protein PilN